MVQNKREILLNYKTAPQRGGMKGNLFAKKMSKSGRTGRVLRNKNRLCQRGSRHITLCRTKQRLSATSNKRRVTRPFGATVWRSDMNCKTRVGLHDAERHEEVGTWVEVAG